MLPILMTGETYAAIAKAADRLETTMDNPLYRVAADWLNSPNPGTTSERIEQQISYAAPAKASLLIEEADAFFAPRQQAQTAPGEPLVDIHMLVKRFTDEDIPVIFTIKDEALAKRISDETGWTLKIAG